MTFRRPLWSNHVYRVQIPDTLSLAVRCVRYIRTSAQSLLFAASQAKDLEFPVEASGISLFTTPRMALYKAEGAGPFPALVLHHQCGGLGDGAKASRFSALRGARKTGMSTDEIMLPPRGDDDDGDPGCKT